MADAILFLMNGWDSAAGGIQTVNRELAVALAKARPDLRCVVVVEQASQPEIDGAFALGVELIHGDPDTGWSSALLSSDFNTIRPDSVLAVIGHSTFSGKEAKMLRDRRFPGAKLVQFVHTSPLHLESMKEQKRNNYIAAREAKVANEIDIARSADLVICIGPRLHRAMHDLIVPNAKPDLKVRQINCGVWRDPGPVRDRPIRPTILSLGRTESIGVKGLDILAYAAGHLQKLWMGHPSTRDTPTPQFIIRGTKENAEEFEQTLVGMATQVGPRPTIIARPYTSIRSELEADYRGASIFMMPSREEGFGLVACEALSFGTPTLVSSESGVAEVLRQAARDNHMEIDHCVISIAGEPQEAGERFAQAALKILTDYPRMRGYFDVMAEHMLELCSWDVGARELLEFLGLRTTPDESVAAADKTASPQARTDAKSIVERNREQLLRNAAIISVSVEEVIVVRVSNGAAPGDLPSHVEGVPVVVRPHDPIQLTASRDPLAGDLMVGNDRSASAMVFALAGKTFALTAKHAIEGAGADPIFLHVSGQTYPANVVLQGEDSDWVVLDVPGLPDAVSPLDSAAATPGEEVVLNYRDAEYRGRISAFSVVTSIIMRDGRVQEFRDLLEVEIEGVPTSGLSGSVVRSAETGAAIGMIIAGSSGKSGPRRLYCYPMDSVQEEVEPALLSLLFPDPPPRIAIFATDQTTTSLALKHLQSVERSVAGGRTFFVGRDAANRSITVCPATAAGNIAAAISVMELIRFSRPDYLLVVGLAGGLDPQMVSRGDVVIASDVVYYEAGVIGGAPLHPKIQIVGKMTARLTRRAELVAQQGGTPDVTAFKTVIGTVASGEKIVRDANALREMISWSRPLAVEMESYGAIEAANNAEREVGVLTIRGISDYADGAKSDDMRDAAAQNAVAVAFELIEKL